MSNQPASTADPTPAREGSGAMFDDIAARYDLLNRIISLGLDQSWRRKTVAALEIQPGQRVLDLATGTADLALRVAANIEGTQVVGLDPSGNMLQVGQRKIDASAQADRVTLVRGDAQAMPFPDDSFDHVCMAFGIRNVPDRPRALREMARITRAGGRIAILELAEPREGALSPLARLHVHHVVPWLGSLLSGSREYRYLQRSIAAFPPPADFCQTMEASGLRMLRCEPMTLGVATLYVATPDKPAAAAATRP
jgi:demethylmenaquinone methyltransferase/2-methoxy-6-polyprenyl-1,4-benzoquinol methylase